jgi:uncharacterized RDD family membrane protein YckC
MKFNTQKGRTDLMDLVDPASGEANPRPPEKKISRLGDQGLWPPRPPLMKKVIPRPAGFLRRAIAFCIDLLIISGLYLVLVLIGIMGMRFSVEGGDLIAFSRGLAPFFSGGFFLFVGYFTFFHAYDGQTPAKMVLRIRVVTMDGSRLSPLHSALRTTGYFLSGPLSSGIGFLISLVGGRKRALHDLLTDSQVVLSP